MQFDHIIWPVGLFRRSVAEFDRDRLVLAALDFVWNILTGWATRQVFPARSVSSTVTHIGWLSIGGPTSPAGVVRVSMIMPGGTGLTGPTAVTWQSLHGGPADPGADDGRVASARILHESRMDQHNRS